MNIPASFMRSEDDLPFVSFIEGVTFQLLKADVENAIFVVRLRFEAGITLPRHKHTGDVHVFTLAGAWRYLEYPEINTKGSYLYEPAGSVHTLHVLADNTEISEAFAIVQGANLDLDDEGNVVSVLDAAAIRDIYIERCQEIGLPKPDFIGA